MPAREKREVFEFNAYGVVDERVREQVAVAVDEERVGVCAELLAQLRAERVEPMVQLVAVVTRVE